MFGDHLSTLDPTGYLDIWTDLDGVTQSPLGGGDTTIFGSGISFTSLGLVNPTGPGFLMGLLGRHATLGCVSPSLSLLGSGGGYHRRWCSGLQLAFSCDVCHETDVPMVDECRVEVA